MQHVSSSASRMHGSITFIACALLLAFFASLAWTAILGKCATYDEPVHALASWLVLHHGDYRIDAENPPLWQHWAGLGNRADALPFDLNGHAFSQILHVDQDLRYEFTSHQLYQTPGVDGEKFIRHSRAMMLMIGVMLGGLIAWSSWRIAGSVAAIGATAFYALDPNFLGHAALVKNDVSLAAAMLWISIAIWLLGERITWLRAANAALSVGATVTIKFNGLIAPFIVAVMLIGRAMMPLPWTCLQSALKCKLSKSTAALILLLGCAATSYLMIWACYHFRFDPASEPGVPLEHTMVYNRAMFQGQRDSPIFELVDWAGNEHLLPQAFAEGLLYQYVFSHSRPGFLCGEMRDKGWWSYYPLAMLFKTPVGTQAAIWLAMGTALYLLCRNPPGTATIWLMSCITIPAASLLLMSMASNVNVGLRHIFSFYPPMYVGVGIVAAKVWPRATTWQRWIMLLPVGMLAVESIAAFPNYIDYFNFPCGGSRGGIELLGDSNLDWGQDLPLLARWQAEHSDRQLYLLYFGMAQPEFFHIKTTPDLSHANVLAVSATDLQAVSAKPATRRRIEYIRSLHPLAVLGGTIYLYDWTPAENQALEQIN
jgi:hypothetical protein